MAAQKCQPPFEKVLNFRDVGSCINRTLGQHPLRPKLLFRSARLDSATPVDRQRLVHEYKIITIIDLRTPTEHMEQERKHSASQLSHVGRTESTNNHLRASTIDYKDVNFNGPAYSSALIKQLTYGQTAKLFGLYIFGYRKEAISVLGKNVMAERGLDGLAKDTLKHCKAEVKQVFNVLADDRSFPVVINCTQGKDRTGLIILLVLLLCDIPQDVIEKDYKLSERELVIERAEKLKEIRSIGLPDSFASCPDGWTGSVCKYVNEELGGIGAYLTACAVTEEQQHRVRRILINA